MLCIIEHFLIQFRTFEDFQNHFSDVLIMLTVLLTVILNLLSMNN